MKIEVSELVQTWTDTVPPRQILIRFGEVKENAQVQVCLTPETARELWHALAVHLCAH